MVDGDLIDEAEHVALIEAAFRIANERVDAWPERHVTGAPERYFCECAATDCFEQILLVKSRYEEVRADSRRFLVVPGHERPEFETVVARHDRHFVVEKPDSLKHIVVPADPRYARDVRAEAAELARRIEASAPRPEGR